ncbi:cleavage stimulation factor subunit 2 tau variant-like [Sorex fumeus]|uniref:cleavage stimulation factor subunit 2 tau variant-like n=1 Tax=Sorex fumeus TaxID=62283 RepID=UPI0024AD54D1|nr:cleavage stimulation factor subunit 2 tau variant-like [Sorex fumeus]
MERSLRSVFVGNIPYEATEEQLKAIFSEVGSVVSFRLVCDRETGQPKGYGFCEYRDAATALSAMRNLNGRECSGRALRVDNVASERTRDEPPPRRVPAPPAPAAATATATVAALDSPYGPAVDPEDAPESIARAVASLPPEQMIELMLQMKLCVQNNRAETRSLLLQNPQLAYALLQAQVVMGLMEPGLALSILHRRTRVVPPLLLGKAQSAASTNAGVAAAGPGPEPAPGHGPKVLPSQQKPQRQPSSARRPAKDIPPPLRQTPKKGGIPAPGGPIPTAASSPGGPILTAAPGPGPGPLSPSRAMQPQVGLPGVRPVPLEQGEVQMADPRAHGPRAPRSAGGLSPQGLLGDAPNDPRGGTLLSVTGEGEPRGRLGPTHQGPPKHLASGHEGRGPSRREVRGGPQAEPRVLLREPRGPMRDPRVNGRAGREARGLEAQAMETEASETCVSERRGMEASAVETRGMEARGTHVRGAMIRGHRSSSRSPMTGAVPGCGPVSTGAGGPQGSRKVPVISGLGNSGAAKQGVGLKGVGVQEGGMQGAGKQEGGMQGAGKQGGGMQGTGLQGGGMQGVGMQKGGMQRVGVQGGSMQKAGVQGVGMQGPGVQGAGRKGGASKQDRGQPSSFSSGLSQVTPQDRKKAALIMQVLQLTADQIATLPPEQRQIILILKEQIQKFAGAS